MKTKTVAITLENDVIIFYEIHDVKSTPEQDAKFCRLFEEAKKAYEESDEYKQIVKEREERRAERKRLLEEELRQDAEIKEGDKECYENFRLWCSRNKHLFKK
jgi:hypothetical protein